MLKLLLVSVVCTLGIQCYEHMDTSPIISKEEPGYIYRPETKCSYKFHENSKTWAEARQICKSEGAELIVIENQIEANISIELMKSKLKAFNSLIWPSSRAYVGLQSLLFPRDFRTDTGVPVNAVYDNWDLGEPNNINRLEDCLTIEVVNTKNGMLIDDLCSWQLGFICKKELVHPSKTPCNWPYKDYYYDEKVDKCTKLSLKPLTWRDAYSVCKAEESHLAFIIDQEDADHFVKIVRNAPKLHGSDGNTVDDRVIMGFHDMYQSGYETIYGTSLKSMEYQKWDNNSGKGSCGSMLFNGKLTDISCESKAMFICERTVYTNPIKYLRNLSKVVPNLVSDACEGVDTPH